jgi:Tfp pilus assembly protein PilN
MTPIEEIREDLTLLQQEVDEARRRLQKIERFLEATAIQKRDSIIVYHEILEK